MENYSTPKKMKPVGDLFSKYKTLLKPPQASVEIVCSKVIKKVTGFDVKKEDVGYTVSTKTINLKLPSVLKSEIKFKLPEIMVELEKELGKGNTPKIFF